MKKYALIVNPVRDNAELAAGLKPDYLRTFRQAKKKMALEQEVISTCGVL